jgi:hypothetical protein
MRLRVLVLAVGLLWPVSVFSETLPVTSFLSGNDLFHVCSDGRDMVRQICEAYVEGVVDALSVANSQIANIGSMPSTCLPKEHLAPDQVKDVVVQYLTAHPETRHQAAAGEAWHALLAAFPCK